MPVVFAQPEVFAPQLLAAYGAAEQQQQNMPLLAEAYARAAQARSAGRGAGGGSGAAEAAQLMARQNEANYGNIQQSLLADSHRQIQERELQLRQQAIAQAGTYTNRDAFNDEAKANTEAGLMRLHESLQEEALTFQEEQKLKTMKTRLTEVLNDQNLTKEEKLQFATMLKTGIDPMEMRQRNAQAKMAEQHANLYEQQAIQQKKVQASQAKIEKMSMPDRFHDEVMPDGSTARFFLKQIDQNGDAIWEQVKQEKAPQHTEFDPEVEAKLTKSAETIAMARAGGRDEQGIPLTKEEIAARAAEMLPKVMEELRAKLQQKKMQGQPGANLGAAAFGGGAAGAATPHLAPSVQEIYKDEKPFKPNEPQSEAQKKIVGFWNTIRTRLDGFVVNPDERRSYEQHIDWAVHMLSQYGAAAKMPPEIRQRYDAIKKATEPFTLFDPKKRQAAADAQQHNAGQEWGSSPSI